MLVELSVTPLKGESHISGDIAEVVQIIESANLDYKLTPSGTCVEGDWDEVMPVMRQCHEQLKQNAPHVITELKIEDEAGAENMLHENVASVKEKIE